jgi:hypothetical protein
MRFITTRASGRMREGKELEEGAAVAGGDAGGGFKAECHHVHSATTSACEKGE